MKRCCFSGHRPEKMPSECSVCGYKIKIALYHQIDKAIERGYTHFICGGCRGVDFWSAERILTLSKNNSQLKLEIAIPFEGQADKWNMYDRKRYNEILQRANFVTRLQDNYTRDCFQKRNVYMINQSSLLIAVWNGKPSGTKNCISYAEKKGVEVKMITVY